MRDDTEEVWRLQIQSLLNQIPGSPVELFQLLHRLIKVLNSFNSFMYLILFTKMFSAGFIILYDSCNLIKIRLLPMFCKMLSLYSHEIIITMNMNFSIFGRVNPDIVLLELTFMTA